MPQRIFESLEGLAEVSKRFHELFSHKDEDIMNDGSFSVTGSSINHCEICPKNPGESCSLSCFEERKKAEMPMGEFGPDGVKVSKG